MKLDRSIRNTDRIVVFSMVVALAACVVGAISVSDASLDTSKWSVTPPASAAAPARKDDPKPIVAKSASEDWFADDSAQGNRPDASH